MRARELMTAEPACCTPDQTVQEAAQLMGQHDCGCIPAVEETETTPLVGGIRNRDITCRCTAEGKGPDTEVANVMSQDPKCCGPDDDVGTIEKIMAQAQVRRVPVVDNDGCCVGMIAQADLARNARIVSDREVG